MGFSLEIHSDAWSTDKLDWLGTRLGTDQARSITVDITTFTVDHYPNGFIPSGTVLAKRTSDGLYVPYDDASLVAGFNVAVGHLLTPVKVKDPKGTTFAKASGALYWMGIVIAAKLPNFINTANLKGELDANARTDLQNFIRYE